jgi:hypothetical protein
VAVSDGHARGEKGVERDEMQQALIRLRASKAESIKKDIESSVECGKMWASWEATWRELYDVVDLARKAQPDDSLYGLLMDYLGDDLDFIETFFPESRGTSLPVSDDMVEAFIEGARLVLNRV